jgi:hypothetical protein
MFLSSCVIAIANCHGASEYVIECKWDYNEVRHCLTVTVATILDPNCFS